MTTSITTARLFDGIERGDYVSFTRMPQFAATTSGLAKGPNLRTARRQRITATTRGTLTVRDTERVPLLEWILARTEDWIVWPCADLMQRIRVTISPAAYT